MYIPFAFAGPLDLSFDSLSIADTRCENFELVSPVVSSSSKQYVVIRLKANNGGGAYPLGAGLGPIVKVYLRLNSVSSGTNTLTLYDHQTYDLGFSTYLGDYVPIFNDGSISLTGDKR